MRTFAGGGPPSRGGSVEGGIEGEEEGATTTRRPSTDDGVAAAAVARAVAATPPAVAPPPVSTPARPAPVPEWILGIISTTFFGPCPRHAPAGAETAAGGGVTATTTATSPSLSSSHSPSHSPLGKRADLTHWCCQCCVPMCSLCIQGDAKKGHSPGHRMQQVKREREIFVAVERKVFFSRRNSPSSFFSDFSFLTLSTFLLCLLQNPSLGPPQRLPRRRPRRRHPEGRRDGRHGGPSLHDQRTQGRLSSDKAQRNDQRKRRFSFFY